MADPNRHGDIFEDVLNLEEQYYREGYDLGIADGTKSGRIEGRVFGLEKGFEKFVQMGRLNGRASVWKMRLQPDSSDTDSRGGTMQLGSLTGNERVRKHIDRLAALSDPDDLSTENNEDAVSEVDDRLKDAKAKATLIARIVGEDDSVDSEQSPESQRRSLRVRSAAAPRLTGEMEDFIGLPGSRG